MALDYKQLFAQVKAELARIHNKTANLENELASAVSEKEAMEATYNALAPLVGEATLPTLKTLSTNLDIEVLKAAGISVAVRAILDADPDEDFTAAAVRDRLAEMGWDWEHYKNPQATVYTTLVRLAAGAVAAAKEISVDGKKAFYSARRANPIQLAVAMQKIGGIGAVTLDNSLREALNKQNAEAAKVAQEAAGRIQASLRKQYESISVPVSLTAAETLFGKGALAKAAARAAQEKKK